MEQPLDRRVNQCLGLLETYVEMDVCRKELDLLRMEKANASYEEIQSAIREKENYQSTLNEVRKIREEFQKEILKED